MSLINVFGKFWKAIEKSDNKRLSGQTPPSGLTQVQDIPYVDDSDSFHLLDVYYPEGTVDKLPVVIDIHGGGWMYGTKELNKNYCLTIAKRGCTVFSINYRLVPDVIMADQLSDVSNAFGKIYELLDLYPCDKSKIYLTGDSAGGQLAAFAAVICGNKTLEEKFDFTPSQLRFNAVGLVSPIAFMQPKGQGAIGIYLKPIVGKGYESTEYADYLNFDSLLKVGKMPPTYLVTSTGDVMAKKQTQRLYEVLKNAGMNARLDCWKKTDGKDLPHVFSVIDPMSGPGSECIGNMLNFFELSAAKTK